MVKLADHLVGDHDRYLVRAGHDDVVAGGAGLELREHRLVGVERVDDHAAVALLLELGYHPGVDVVAPGVDVKLRLRRAAACKDTEGERTARQNFDHFHQVHFLSCLVLPTGG